MNLLTSGGGQHDALYQIRRLYAPIGLPGPDNQGDRLRHASLGWLHGERIYMAPTVTLPKDRPMRGGA